MIQMWALNRAKGFDGAIFTNAMYRQSKKTFAADVDHSLASELHDPHCNRCTFDDGKKSQHVG